MKKRILVLAMITLTAFLVSCKGKQTTDGKVISFNDDLGTKIELKSPAKKIISLYSAHTENLFSLGLNEEIIGVGKAETYPKEVLKKKAFDYKGDPEAIIKEKPDVVLMRTTISKTYPDFVKTLQNAGIQVITLYPETFEGFDKYIETLGVLTGKEKEAKSKLDEFHKQLDELKARGSKATDKKKVFLETMATDVKTAAKGSLAWNAVEFAGGINIAGDAKGSSSSGSIAAFGEEKIISKAEDIDVYVAQKGGNNPNVAEDLIKKRPGFEKIKAVKENKILIIDEKLVSSPTFRYIQGVTELQKYLYPELNK